MSVLHSPLVWCLSRVIPSIDDSSILNQEACTLPPSVFCNPVQCPPSMIVFGIDIRASLHEVLQDIHRLEAPGFGSKGHWRPTMHFCVDLCAVFNQ